MILCPSSRLLIHILAAFCLTYQLVSSVDTDLIDALAADDAAANAKSTTTEETTTGSSQSTTSDYSTTEGLFSTTEEEMNTTESIFSTSLFPANLSCIPSPTDVFCVFEGTEDQCDPCLEVVDNYCDADKSCVSDNSTCTTMCECTDSLKTPNKDGVCTNPCDAKPCQNNQPCVTKVDLKSKFFCDCSSDYEGETCGTVHNYCTESQPALCPKGAFECVFKGVGKYDCQCAGGHFLDKDTNTCVKVTQKLGVTLSFNSLYMEAYNVEGTKERKMAIDEIGNAMKELYGSLLISIAYDNFTQGSVVAHYAMSMRMPPNGDSQQSVYDLMKYVTNCETNNAQNKKCFGDLGKPHLPQNGAISEDLRCNDVYCPVGTGCVPVDKSENSVRCSCSTGYKLNKTVVEDTGRQIDVCDDIDECSVDPPCKTDQLCVNTPGSFECYGSPCEKNPCPGNAVCKAVDHFAYDCQCEWIYIASDCGTPWPLILVIVSSVLLALLILAVIGLIILFSRSRKGSSVIDTTSF